ncbi:MAG TPA: UpxY family transcription antiterminator [Vicinamibacterales bacterium]|nr:UpxY family transcription antiterminator [Vicinamibacterales bacterium]
MSLRASLVHPSPHAPLGHPAGTAPIQARVDTDVAWFAIWTRSRHEATVLSQLDGKHIEAFLPTITRWSRWKDRKKRVDWPLFPGYCFTRIDPADSLSVLKCSGVVSLVCFEGQPAPIADVEIESLRTLVASELRYDPCPMIHEGMVVEVQWGPLRGVVGRLVRKGAHARLILSVDLIGQGVSVEVDAADVRPY